MMHRRGFTLIELLVVIAIIAILAVVVVLTLNPAQLLAQSRDSSRVSDMATIQSALNLYQTDQSGSSGYSLGSISSTYISLPDTSSSCGSLGLPALPSGDSWACASSAGYRTTNNAGWIPLNFQSISAGSPFGSIPIDPVNQTSSNLFYAYNTNGIQYEVTANLESTKYKQMYAANPQTSMFPDVISGGAPNVSMLYNPTGLVGYWPLDEGSGTVASDLSGSGNSGTWSGTPVNGSYYTAGKVGAYAGNFDGSSDSVTMGVVHGSLDITGPFTFAAWINLNTYPSGNNDETLFIRRWNGSVSQYEFLLNNSQGGCSSNPGALQIDVFPGSCTKAAYPYSNIPAKTWHFAVATFSGSAYTLYVDGVQVATTASATPPPESNEPVNIGGYSAGNFFSGAIDDVRAYSRALSAAEVMALYNAEK